MNPHSPTRRDVCRAALGLLAGSCWGGAALAQEGRPAANGERAFAQTAREAIQRAATYFRRNVAIRGGYVRYYSLDLRSRWAFELVPATVACSGPIGTSGVGEVMLDGAALGCGDDCFDGAIEAAKSLGRGQLLSGGWAPTYQFGPGQEMGDYWLSPSPGAPNVSSLMDDHTTSALRFVNRLAASRPNPPASIVETLRFAHDAFFAAQFPAGGFPPCFSGPAPPLGELPAAYPAPGWSVHDRPRSPERCYCLGRDAAKNVGDYLWRQHFQSQGSRREVFQAAAAKFFAFLLRARMPAPQPAWCAAYDETMTPTWCGDHAPPAISIADTVAVLDLLRNAPTRAGWAEPRRDIEQTCDYLESLERVDGRFARYYELQSNRPLFIDASGRIVYHVARADPRRSGTIDVDLSRFAGERPSNVRILAGGVIRVMNGRMIPIPDEGEDRRAVVAAIVKSLEGEAERIVSALDDEGRWVSTYSGERLTGDVHFPEGYRYLSTQVFVANMRTLVSYLQTAQAERSGANFGRRG